tara:strand:- start:33 stop:686 length:654 start_codon:yes stop_codon:yes gene_type:complete
MDPLAMISVPEVIVPVVVKFSLPKLIAPLESVIDPFASVMLPITEPVAPLTVPVVVKFSLPKLIAPLESVIEPFASVRLPSDDPVAAVIVPVVVRFSLPKLIAPLESVIEPFASVMFPTVVPVPAEMAPENVVAPDTLKVPSTINPSLMLIVVESVELRVVPAICMAPKITLPVPAGSRFMSSFDLVPIMLLPLIVMQGTPPHLIRPVQTPGHRSSW